MRYLTAKEAKETIIFFLENREVQMDCLYNFVMQSAEQVTTRIGIENRLHIVEDERDCNCIDDDGNFDNECPKCWMGRNVFYKVCKWDVIGSSRICLQEFEFESEAEDYIFNDVYNIDFEQDTNRDTNYFFSEQEAEEYIIKRLADEYNINLVVAKSIRSKELKILARKKEIAEFEKNKERENKNRVNELAQIYANMIERVEGESFHKTCQRLKCAIGEKIESSVFFKAVKIVRAKK